MNLKEKINSDFVSAYKLKDMDKKNFLGVLKGAIQTQEGKMIESTDENVLKVVKSFEKSIKETKDAKIKMGESTEQQDMELSYIESYLPKLMSENEVETILVEMMSRDGVNKNVGFLMGLFNKENAGKAFDNKMVSSLIQKHLK